MKVKLLEPIEGYEDVADYLIPEAGQTVWCEGTPLTPSTLPFGYHLILTKKQSLTESLGLEVGACYFRDYGSCLIEILDDDHYRLHDFSGGGKTHGSPRLRYLDNPSAWRKVINADGSMVDGDLEWVTVGGFEVPKVDLDEWAGPCYGAYLDDGCCCRQCVPF